MDKEIIEETKKVEEKPKKKRKKLIRAFKDNEEKVKEQKARYIVELVTVVVFSLIMLVLLCNRTFFKNEYRTSKIAINIPLLMFYEKDTGNQLTMKTLRKSQYVKDYFDGELSKMTRYNCDGVSFYYIDETQTAIYDLKVEKDFGIKTVIIDYAKGDADCLCAQKVTREAAEKICNVK